MDIYTPENFYISRAACGEGYMNIRGCIYIYVPQIISMVYLFCNIPVKNTLVYSDTLIFHPF